MSRTRAGRKAYETHNNWKRSVGDAVSAIANAKWKYSVDQTKAMIIERTAKETGKTEVITFSMAYGELSIWKKSTFKGVFGEENSELGFSDLLADAFFAGKTIETAKAVYKLWVRPEPQAAAEPKSNSTEEILQVCLNDRLDEFQSAASRAADWKMGVFADWDKDTFVVVNINTKKEYGVVLQARQNRVFASCTCKGFTNRGRVCKHITEVLKESFAGHFAGLSAALDAESDREAWAYINEIV